MASMAASAWQLFTPAYSRSRIDAVDSQIADLKRTIKQLKLERFILETHLETYVYPVLTLPNEIISEIFLQSLSPSDSLSGPTSPIFLGHICRKWRAITLSTPTLWTVIRLDVDTTTKHEKQLRLLDIWLARSRDCPLSISITEYCHCPISESFASRFLAAIIPHSRRWRSVSLHILFSAFPMISGELPILSELTITSASDHLPNIEHPDAPWPLAMFKQAPKLRRVSLCRVDPNIFHLPWAQITCLSITQPDSFNDLSKILTLVVNVAFLVVQITHDTPASLPVIPPLLHLRHLTLAGYEGLHPAMHAQFMDTLTLPALTHLETEEHCLAAIQNLIVRSQCCLDGLRISMAQTMYRAVSSPTEASTLKLIELQSDDIETDMSDSDPDSVAHTSDDESNSEEEEHGF
ncbi:hypothetical protein C8R43DRAFT_1083210 [Mycena crocata]|nr:hypothetical protein C8R43DRAFT_1083210 [Mycena crocata]